MEHKAQRVWLILAEVLILGKNPGGFKTGSKALVQCFVPQTVLETALLECDRALNDGGMRRIDVRTCSSFEWQHDESEAADFVKRDVQQARESGKTVIGTFLFNRDTASFEEESDKVN